MTIIKAAVQQCVRLKNFEEETEEEEEDEEQKKKEKNEKILPLQWALVGGG